MTRPADPVEVEETAAEPAAGSIVEGSEAPVLTTELVILALCVGAVATAWVALVLAQAGVFSLPAVIVGVAAVLAVFAGLGLLVRPTVGRRWPAAALAGAALVAGLVMFLPGAPYVFGDKDPGIYVLHGAAIERHGSTDIPDELRESVPETVLYAPGARFPGIWIEEQPDQVTPQFYHLFPSLLAVANAIGGLSLSFHVSALLGALSVTALALAVRRVAGLAAGALTAGFLVVNMLQVWQAKYPTTEILTQLSITGALLGVAVTMRTGWRPAAAAAGFLTGMAFLARPDGLVVVLLALAVTALAIVIVPRDRRPWWFLAGLALPLLHGLVNAYSIRRGYSLANDLPELPLTLGVISLLVVGTVAVLFARSRSERLDRFLEPAGDHWGSWARWGAVGLAGLTAVVLVGFWERAHFFGEDMFDYNGRIVRSFDEFNLLRLTWFWPVGALALGVLGILALGFWRRYAATWVVALVLLPALPLYLWAAKNSPRLMWWGRRYVPAVLPLLVVLAAIGAAWLLTRGRWWIKVPTAALVVALLAHALSMSWPLRDHREFGGSASFNQELADLTGDGIVLWEQPVPNDIFGLSRNIPSVQWLVHDVPSAYLDVTDPVRAWAAVTAAYPAEPIYIAVEDGDPPAGIPRSSLDKVGGLEAAISYWDEDKYRVPDEALGFTKSLEVYRIVR